MALLCEGFHQHDHVADGADEQQSRIDALMRQNLDRSAQREQDEEQAQEQA